MTTNGLLQIALYFVVLLLLVKPLGAYMARVFDGPKVPLLGRVFGPVERLIYRLCGVRPEQEQTWRGYALGMLAFNLAGFLLLYLLLRIQHALPLNGGGLADVDGDTSFNIAVSFATNTNWQNYSPELTVSWLVQMLGFTVQNFVSAATGMAVLVPLIRAFARKESRTVGNFWTDLTRTTLYILLPLSFVLALVNVSRGSTQTFDWSHTAQLLQPVKVDNAQVTQQTIVVGPVASQVAIKQLGTNGGGFFNMNSAQPFENPDALSDFLEVLAILMIAGALTYTFGRMVGDTRQGWALLAAMTVILVPLMVGAYAAESHAPPILAHSGADVQASALSSGGNMEGKEVRFGIAGSTRWAAATTAASNGSVNSMHDSYTPLGGLVPLWLMQLGEVVYGGVGSGLYGFLIFAIIAVFVAGLMVGRTPEYLGKKIGAFEMQMAAIVALIPHFAALIPTAIGVVTKAGLVSMANPGAHGFTEILYAYSSMGNNNGSAFAGITADTVLMNTAGGLGMLFSRYWCAVPALAIAGSLARKKKIEPGPGTLPTHTPLFVVLVAGVVVIVGALSFLPALALGPIAEHFQMIQP